MTSFSCCLQGKYSPQYPPMKKSLLAARFLFWKPYMQNENRAGQKVGSNGNTATNVTVKTCLLILAIMPWKGKFVLVSTLVHKLWLFVQWIVSFVWSDFKLFIKTHNIFFWLYWKVRISLLFSRWILVWNGCVLFPSVL